MIPVNLGGVNNAKSTLKNRNFCLYRDIPSEEIRVPKADSLFQSKDRIQVGSERYIFAYSDTG